MHVENSPKVSEMSDVAVAKGIIADTFELKPGNRSIVIGLAIAALKRIERKLDPRVLRERNREWTERRVRAIIDEEARRIDAYEIEDLKQMQLAEARIEFDRSRARAERLAAFLAVQDEDFHGIEIDRLRQCSRGMGRPGNSGAAQ